MGFDPRLPVLILISQTLLLGVQELGSAPPVIEHLFPAGASVGSTQSVHLAGSLDPWPLKVWSDQPDLAFIAETNKGRFQVAIPPEASPGPRLVRFYHEEGSSEPCLFVVGQTTEITEAEPNNHFAKAQAITCLPIAVNGHLEKNGDVDSFAVDVPAGKWLDARLDAYRLMGKLDALLRLVTTNGQILAWNHDDATLDPRLVWQAPRDTHGVLQVMGFAFPATAEVRLSGGKSAVYRLHVALTEGAPGDGLGPANEAEPNDSHQTAQALTLPSAITGCIGNSSDNDYFAVSLEKDQPLELRLEAASRGSPLDAWLKIEDSTNREMARADDTRGSPDPAIEWQSPSDGTYFIVVGSVTHRGGSPYRYRLEARRSVPSFRSSLPVSSIAVSAGQTNDLKCSLKRLNGFDHTLMVSAAGLPPGISVEPVQAPAKDGEILLKLIAQPDAAAYQGPIQVLFRDEATGQTQASLISLTSSTKNNGVPGGFSSLLIESTDQLWLTVRPKPAAPPQPTEVSKH